MPRRTNAYYLKWSTFFSALTLYTPIVPLYFMMHGIGVGTVVLAQTFYSLAIVLLEVPTGVLADRFGHRKSVIASALIGPLGLLVVIPWPNIRGLFISYLLFGLSQALESGSKEALLYETNRSSGVPGTFKKQWAHILSYDTLAFAVGTAIVGVVYGRFGSSAFVPLIWVTAVTKLITLAITLRLRDVPIENSAADKGSGMWKLLKSSTQEIRQSPTLRTMTYVKLLTLPGIYVLYSSYQGYFEANGVTPYFIGFVLTLGALANSIALRNAHRLERYLSLDKAVLYLALLLGISHLLFSVIHQPWLLVLTYILIQAQYDLQEPIISDYINDRVPSAIRASTLSGISLIRQIGNTMQKFLLGLSLTPFGVPGMLRILSIYLIVGGVVSYWLLARCGCTYTLQKPGTSEVPTPENPEI
jgi:MFS family permease